jgi:cell shape-determining protein MreC
MINTEPSTKMKKTNLLFYRFLIIFTIIFISSLYIIKNGQLPGIYGFATDSNQSNMQRLFSAPIHLSDDVMISLRTR